MIDLGPRVDVLGVPMTPCTVEQAVDRVADWIRSGRRSFGTFTGVHGIMEAQRDPDVLQAHQDAGLVACDGAPTVWASRWAGADIPTRLTGREFMVGCLSRAATEGWTSFFYGGGPGRAEGLAASLALRFPGLQIAGTFTPPYHALSESEDADVVDMLNASGADLVWVGLSTPKQELWMADHRGRLEASALFGVGAAFDYLAGDLAEAPRWMQRTGLEWSYRIALEPRRLAGRYAKNIPAFMREIVRRRPTLIRSEDAWGPRDSHGSPM